MKTMSKRSSVSNSSRVPWHTSSPLLRDTSHPTSESSTPLTLNWPRSRRRSRSAPLPDPHFEKRATRRQITFGDPTMMHVVALEEKVGQDVLRGVEVLVGRRIEGGQVCTPWHRVQEDETTLPAPTERAVVDREVLEIPQIVPKKSRRPFAHGAHRQHTDL